MPSIQLKPCLMLLCVAMSVVGANAEEPVRFNRDIRPILSDNCFACHGPDQSNRQAELRLDQAGDGDLNGLIQRILAEDDSERMPPPTSQKQLTDAQKILLQRWVSAGAEYEPHWSFVPPIKAETAPAVGLGASHSSSAAIDQFIRSELQKHALKPSPRASPATLVRRVALDLTGLPPTFDEQQRFASEESYETMVDYYLARPAYGEHMAVAWLDAARYADTNGYQVDRDRELWPWRDWVVRAFNENMPFEQFTIEQLAGDLLPNPTLDQRIATGFNRNHMMNEEGGIIAEEFLAEYTADRVETTAAVWLGQTFNCARCHDHKYDPFTQRDFYAMKAYFHNVPERGVGDYSAHIRQNSPPFLKLSAPEVEAKLNDLRTQIKSINEQLAALTTITTDPTTGPTQNATSDALAETATAERAKLNEKLTELNKQVAAAETEIPTTLIMEELPEARPTYILLRGAYDKPGEQVMADTPAVLPKPAAELPRNRLGLAQWLVSRDNPLTARVTVNRFWQQLFGAGLVRSSEDFGAQGDLPSHPELLDWLAVSFQESGWNVKQLIRQLVMSETYRQSSRHASDPSRESDPSNRWLARAPRHRLAAEVIRDQALAASGLLVNRLGGPTVKPYHPPGLYEQVVNQRDNPQATYQQGQGEDLHRRSLYTYWKRSVPHPAMMLFDAPFREVCSMRRSRSNTPLQALNLLNDPTYVEAARCLAQRMIVDGGETTELRVEHGFQLLLARRPAPAELKILTAAVERCRQDFANDAESATQLLTVGATQLDATLEPVELAAFTALASTLLNLDETLSKE